MVFPVKDYGVTVPIFPSDMKVRIPHIATGAVLVLFFSWGGKVSGLLYGMAMAMVTGYMSIIYHCGKQNSDMGRN